MLTSSQQKVFDFLSSTIQSSIPPTVREICNATGLSSTSTVHAILNKLEDLGLIERDKKNSRAIHIVGAQKATFVPLVGRVQAGLPTLAVQEIETYVPFTNASASKEYFALRVRGESMIEAAILEDDIVICERTPVANEGEIVVALIDDEEATIKYFHRCGKGFEFRPANESFSPIFTTNAQILGKVTTIIRNY